MENTKTIKNFKLYKIFTPFVIVIISCSLLIFVNYYTIKILSSCRAYVNGESHYSKAQKDGARHLTTYLFTKDFNKWELFNKELTVSKGDGIARVGLQNNAPIELIRNGFKVGRNDEKDIDDMIWLFKNFKNVSFFKAAIKQWSNADRLIIELADLGNEILQNSTTSELTVNEKKVFLKRINKIAAELTTSQRQFSDSLGQGTRSIKNYLLFINIFLTLIIIGCVSSYYALMINKLRRAQIETEQKNSKLLLANKELDRFVYSASHDLRAPISSLQGLIEVMKLEDDIEQFKIYLNLMDESLNKQDKYIRDIIDYSRNTRKKTSITEVSLNKIISEAISQNQFAKESNKIKITTDLAVDMIKSDELKLKIIINNFLSNAIKYSDPTKNNQSFCIRTYRDKNCFKIEFKDNGIGIDLKYQEKIFEMFFVTENTNKGSGLGLYIVKEAVENLNGSISIDSQIAIGTTFTVTIPE